MRNVTEKRRVFRAGFTLTELLVLVAMGGILSGLLVADLSQTRAKLLQQACAANLKQWGMAISLYTQDYDGTYFYAVGTQNFDDPTDPTGTIPNPYLKYFGGSDAIGTLRRMRICPFVAAAHDPATFIGHTYSMPIPDVYFVTAGYAPPTHAPFYVAGNYWPSVKFLRGPSKFLLLMDSGGHTLLCGKLQDAVTGANGTSSGDTTPAINRHPGGVNCLFGDFHVEAVTFTNIVKQDAIGCAVGNPWFMMN